MKTLLTLPVLTLCLMLTACADSSAPQTDTAADITAASNKVEANITGMSCTGCSGEVCSAVEQVAGVTKAWADPKTGDVVVALTDDADAAATKAEVEKVITGLSDGKYTINKIDAVSADTHACPDGCTKDCCKEPADKAPVTDEQAGLETEQVFVYAAYNVTGMDCSACSSQIVTAVEKVDGVIKAEADAKTGRVVVSFEDRFDDKKKTDEIKDLIAGLSDGKYTVSY